MNHGLPMDAKGIMSPSVLNSSPNHAVKRRSPSCNEDNHNDDDHDGNMRLLYGGWTMKVEQALCNDAANHHHHSAQHSTTESCGRMPTARIKKTPAASSKRYYASDGISLRKEKLQLNSSTSTSNTVEDGTSWWYNNMEPSFRLLEDPNDGTGVLDMTCLNLLQDDNATVDSTVVIERMTNLPLHQHDRRSSTRPSSLTSSSSRERQPQQPQQPQHHHQSISASTTSTQRVIMIEIAPDISVRLRGANETWDAVQHDFYAPWLCCECHTTIFCIADADFVLCPQCRVINPFESSLNSNSCSSYVQQRQQHEQEDDNDYYSNKNNQSGSMNSSSGGGVGLGFTMDQLSQWQIEFIMQQQQQQHDNCTFEHVQTKATIYY